MALALAMALAMAKTDQERKDVQNKWKREQRARDKLNGSITERSYRATETEHKALRAKLKAMRDK